MKVLVSCVSENRPDWFSKAYGLAFSVRELGGRLSTARVVVNFVDAVEPRFARRLEELDAEVRVIERVDDRNAFANKLRMLELAENDDFDVLAQLDCDTIVVGDFSEHLSTERIGAKPADYDRLTDREWRRMFAGLGITPPQRTLTATATGRPMYPYFNSGVLFVPRQLCTELRRVWELYHSRVLELFRHDGHVIPRHWQWQVNQYSLAAALLNESLPHTTLPVSINFPTHIPVHPSVLDAATQPLILHYHQEIDSRGFLMRSRHPLADPYLDRFNARLAAAMDIPYRGVPSRPRAEALRRTLRQRFWSTLAKRHRVKGHLSRLIR